MELKLLDKDIYYHATLYACQHLILQREALNAINVFPIADGDTGDNMAATARAILFYGNLHTTLRETALAIADASLMGARGNSGMIFSEFFNGLAENIAPSSQAFSPEDFAAVMTKSCAQVREAIQNPVEGTILTVMEQWSSSLCNVARDSSDFKVLFKRCAPTLEQSLAATEHRLEALQNAHVVDAGALGFVHFIQGFTAFLHNPALNIEDEQPIPSSWDKHDVLSVGEAPNLRYCTEAIISHKAMDKTQLSQLLSAYGENIVISSNARLARFHLHCNKPWELFEKLRTFGHIQYPKVDDMLRQYESIHHRKHRIALVTDSSADITESYLDAHQIHIIPINVHIDNNDLLDRLCINSEQLYAQLDANHAYPTTSFPAPARIRHTLHSLAKHYEQVIVISIAQVLSGTHDAIVNAAKAFDNVHVVNSQQVSAGQGLLLKVAAEGIAAGHRCETILKELSIARNAIETFVIVEQFDSLIRSGRVGFVAGKLAQFSGIKPILCLDDSGKAVLCDKAFSFNKALTNVVERIAKKCVSHSLLEYALVHAGAKEQAIQFSKLCEEALGLPPLFIVPVSTSIGLHAGKGALAITARFATENKTPSTIPNTIT